MHFFKVFEFFIVTEASSLTLSIVGVVKEITAILLDVFFNGSELSPINVVGCFVCLVGIGLHVARKATNKEMPGKSSSGGRFNRRRRQYEDYNLPLLSDDESDFNSDSSDELFNPGNSRGSFREFDDDFYLRDNREWTSVRDSHMKSLEGDSEDAPSTLPIPDVLKEKKEPKPLIEVQLLSD